MKKILSLILCVSIVAVMCMVSACTKKEAINDNVESISENAEKVSKDEEKGKLSFYAWDEGQRGIMEAVIDVFHKTYPNVEVELTIIPWDDYWLKMQTSLNTDNGPDVFWMNTTYTPDYIPAGMVENLTPYIEAENIDMSVFPQVFIDCYSYEGNLYGIPKDFDTIGLFYNKSLFDEAGVAYPTDDWTWDDMYEASKKLASAGVMAIDMDLSNDQTYVANFIYTNDGGRCRSEDGTSLHMNTPAVKEAFEYMMKYVDEGLSPDYNAMQELGAHERFMGGLSAMTMSGSWNVRTYMEALGEENLGVVEVPANKVEACCINGLAISINANSKVKDLAWEFVKTFTTVEGGKAQAQTVIPANKEATSTWQENFGDFDVSCFMRSTETALPCLEATKKTSEQYDTMLGYFQRIWSKELSIEEGLAQLDKDCEAIAESK